jgi:peptidoglycan/xylan/chitin deacetylase (PgdA/CDA1 family)
MRGTPRRLVLDIHGIGPKPAWIQPDEDSYWCDHPATFERILDQVSAAFERDGTRIEITFDDGNASDASIAVPALARRKLRAAFFVCAGRIGTPGYLDRAALADLLAAGMQIGSHGWSHVDWSKIDDATLEVEVNDAKRSIEDATGRPVDAVAIPFGRYNRRVMGRLGGFRTIYTSDGGFAREGGRIVPRNSYRKHWGDTTLAELCAGRERLLRKTLRPVRSTLRRLL